MGLAERIAALRNNRADAIRIFREIYQEVPKYDNHLEIKGDWAIASDFHAPYFSDTWVSRLVRISQKYGITKLLIPGDFFDQKAFTEFLPSSYQDESPELELTRSGLLLETICNCYNEVLISVGNHDKRLFKMCLGKVSFRKTVQMILEKQHTNLTITDYPYVIINPKKIKIGGGAQYVDGWRVTHPKNYSIITARVPTNLADKYSMNVLSAHGHHFGFSYSKNGRYICIDIGGMFDLLKQEYIMYSDTTHPVWNNGFIILKDNIPILFHDKCSWKEAS